MAPRLQERYETQIRKAWAEELGISNANAIPRVSKIVINMGVGRATQQERNLQ